MRRARHELTRADLAEGVGISRQRTDAIEADRYDPSPELALGLADRFDCAIEGLFSHA